MAVAVAVSAPRAAASKVAVQRRGSSAGRLSDGWLASIWAAS